MVPAGLTAVLALLAPHASDAFATGSVTVAGETYAYRLLSPERVEPDRLYPVVLFLHGASERGDDNEAQLAHFPARMAEPVMRARYPCFVVAPQCRADERWVDAPWSETESRPLTLEPTAMLRQAVAALDDVLATQPVDRDRVYLTGLSMGGFGAWELGCRDPERFAAVVPICGGGDERWAHRLAGVPVWAWHGAADDTVPPVRSRAMIAAIRAAGGKPRLAELAGVGHDAWTAAYGAGGVLPWLFAQRRGDPTSVTFERGATGPLVVEEPPSLARDACFVNHNDRGDPARRLRVTGALEGGATLRIAGLSEGGVELAADSRRRFSGPVIVESGRLIVAHDGALGSATPTTLRRGAVVHVAAGVELTEPFVVEGRARLELGGFARLGGELLVRRGGLLRVEASGAVPRLEGRLWGVGDVTWNGGVAAIAGRDPNLLSGRFELRGGTLALEKPEGVLAIGAELVLGGGEETAILRWGASHQVADGARVNARAAVLELGAHAERLGPLSVLGDVVVVLEEGADLRFADSRAADWSDGKLVIVGWIEGKTRVGFGRGARALTPAQLAQVGFRDAEHTSVLHPAALTQGGELVPAR